MSEAALEIGRLGARGDGIADRPGEAVCVPFALPGETIRAEVGGGRARLVEILKASPDRVRPVCRHFGQCGGCAAQHMSDRLYAKWKQGIVTSAFAHRGIAAQVAPLRRVGLNSRRRAYLGVMRRGIKAVIGFREEGSHTLVDLAECPVLDPAIAGAIDRLREMAIVAMPEGRGGRLLVTRLDQGLDVAFDNGRKALSPDAREKLAALAEAAGVRRLTVAGEAVVETGSLVLTTGGVAVELPPGAFIQAVPEAEAMLIELVLEAAPRKAKKVADLFCGLGTFTFALARGAAVAALDGDRRAIGALTGAAKRTQGLKPIETRVRDLFREPLSVKELEPFDAVVFDPPRAGAAAQAERLAKSQVPVVVAVSCNPATLARDARTLVDGGYTMGPVTPIDQFVFSPHVEVVTTFRR